MSWLEIVGVIGQFGTAALMLTLSGVIGYVLWQIKIRQAKELEMLRRVADTKYTYLVNGNPVVGPMTLHQIYLIGKYGGMSELDSMVFQHPGSWVAHKIEVPDGE